MKKRVICAMWIFLILCFAKDAKSICSTPSFNTLSSLNVNRPKALAPADFNRDGKTDLAILRDSLNPNAGLVQIWLGDGASNYNWTGVDYPSVLTNVVDITVGEFNQDGLLDLAVVGGPSPNYVVAVLLGNGNGSFGAPTSFPIGDDPRDIAVADFNNDGRLDIITASFSGRVATILPNLGNNNFGTAVTISTGGITAAPIAIVTGKFNNDNNQDFLTVNNDRTVSVRLGNGNLTFNIPASSPTNLPGTQQDIEIGDFNRDGLLDFATASFSDVVSIRLGNENGLFTQPTSDPFPVTNVANHLAVADFNADGKPDIASANNGLSGNNNLSILLNSSGGNFSQSFNFTAEVGISQKVYALDFDRNRSSDLLILKEVGDNKIVRFQNTCFFPNRSISDFDGDSQTDLAIFRPNTGEWWNLRSSDGGNAAAQFGISTDKITPGDYTGDGKTDMTFFRPSSGFWYIRRSEDNTFYSFPFGTNGDIPAPADYDADGKTDPAVFRPSNATWYIRRSSDNGTTIQQFGALNDKPVAADYDGDGKADIAIFRPAGANGAEWWILRSLTGSVAAYQFGVSTDKAVQGDYTGDGKADIAVWRQTNGTWFILRSENDSYYSFPFGTNGDLPVSGDYDGDGKNDAGVFRPSNATWYVQRSTAGTLIRQFGNTGDLPVPNAFGL